MHEPRQKAADHGSYVGGHHAALAESAESACTKSFADTAPSVASWSLRIISGDGIRAPRLMREIVERSTLKRSARVSSETSPADIH
jgi:hypothetical protein